jgi:hypothetical protein
MVKHIPRGVLRSVKHVSVIDINPLLQNPLVGKAQLETKIATIAERINAKPNLSSSLGIECWRVAKEAKQVRRVLEGVSSAEGWNVSYALSGKAVHRGWIGFVSEVMHATGSRGDLLWAPH